MGRLMEYSFLILAALALTASGRRLPRGISLHPGGNAPPVLTLASDRPQSLHLTRTFAHHVPARTVRIVKTVGVKYPVPYPVRNDVVVHVPKPYPVPVPFAQKVPVYVNAAHSAASSGAAGYGSGAGAVEYGSGAAGYGSGAAGYGSGEGAEGYGSGAAGYGSGAVAAQYGSGAAGFGSGAAGYESGAGSDASYHGDASSGLAGAEGSSGYGSSAAGFTAPASGYGQGAEGSAYGVSPAALVGYAVPSTHDGAYTQQSQGHAGLTQAVFLAPGNGGYENGINAGYAGAAGYAPAYSGAPQAGAEGGYAQGGGNAIGAIDAGFHGAAGQEGGDNSGAYATTAGDAYANYGKVPVSNAGYQATVGNAYPIGESQVAAESSNEKSREGVDDGAAEAGGQQSGQGETVKTLVTIEKAVDMGSYSYFGNNAVH